MRFIGLLLCLFISGTSFSSIQPYPAHWWVGMKNPRLQLMLHSDRNLPSTITLTYPGITITKVHQPENKHYLFVDLLISPSAQPGQLNFKFSDGSLFSYTLKQRMKFQGEKVHQGVRSDDLIYLIIPDRFANGDPSNDRFTDMRDTIADRNNPYARHGGDIAGIAQRLDYFKEIGVTALWMTPMQENNMPQMQEGPWKMSGYHGYWITNHYKIDKRHGGNEAYRQLVKAAHAKGIKIIQDAVYNHVGSYHHTVVDLPMNDWLNQWPSYTGSNHREELFIDPYASQSEKKVMIGGWFVPHLPDLNLANPYCANYVIQNNIWSTEEFGIDGWRVDTYKYCDEKFLNTINTALLREFPTLTVFGEAWTNTVPASAYFTQNNINAPFKHTIQGVTDFPLNSAIYNALNDPFGWTDGVMRLYMTLSQDILYKDPQTNCIFLDNHDMNRFYSMVGEDLKKYKMGLGLLFTLRGIPQVYYGTEILMKNYKDPNDAAVRKDFPGGWKEDAIDKFNVQTLSPQEKEAFTYFSRLAKIRKNTPAISKGKTIQFIPQNGLYVYFKQHKEQVVMCLLNTNSESVQLDPTRYSEVTQSKKQAIGLLDESSLMLTKKIDIAPKSFHLYELKN
ncbi:MAG: alpha-amylase family glycosyl hydrolase [Chitinophagaceae bacterium]|jgi:glycosidase